MTADLPADPAAPLAPVPDLPPEFALLYDEDVLAEIERRRVVPAGPAVLPEGGGEHPAEAPDDAATAGPAGRVRRLGASGAVLAGVMLGVGEVLEPERAKQTVIEFAPAQVDEDEQLVTFHLVPGDPRASRLVIRPWLLERFRARREG
jgi:hypothetical protein